MKLKQVTAAVFILALLGSLGILWLAPANLQQQAPAITLTTLHGQKLSLPALRGRPLLVNFWATTCPACIKEMPGLVKLYQEFAPRGLEVIGIAMAYDPPDRVMAFSNGRQIPYPIALDINSDAARAFGDVHLTPTSFLVAPDGCVVHRKTGKLNLSKVRELVRDMLAKTPSDEYRTKVN